MATRRIELLAPAGDATCLRAAIENGADAVYFGLDRGFNARARAENLSLDNLPDIMQELRRRGVRGYVTLNTLVFSDELSELERLVARVAEAGVDAVLVQDLGVARLIRAVCPELPLHASTQMTLTSAETIAAVASLGIERVVLARELSLDEIRQIAAHTTLELEVFVHGALCVAYSGQCLTSESLGGRSANRGQCAQACRLPYDILSDGELVDLDRQKFLLSPQDLAAYDLVPALLDAGVCSLKIEGRLKSPEYVASVTSHYRQAIDATLRGMPSPMTDAQQEEMELTFSRGFAPGWLEGCDHKRLVPGYYSSKRGVWLGEIVAIDRGRVCAQITRPLHVGDGLMFDSQAAQNEQPGGRIFAMWHRGRRVDFLDERHFEDWSAADNEEEEEPIRGCIAELSFGQEFLDLERLQPGDPIWKTDDPQLTRQLRWSFSQRDPLHRRPIDIEIWTEVGAPLRIRATLENGASFECVGTQHLEAARKRPVTREWLQEQLDRLGHTPFALRELIWHECGSPMVPMSLLGDLRRELLERIEAHFAEPPTRSVHHQSVLEGLRPPRTAESAALGPPRLRVLCRSQEQLQVLCAPEMADCHDLFVDFADIRLYGDAVTCAHAAGRSIGLATPRIHKPGETGIWRAMLRYGADSVLARNGAAIDFFVAQQVAVWADYSLNVANELTAAWIMERGVQGCTASYDLNRDQLLSLVEHVPPAWLEVVIHQHMPMFHMEHCVFCAVLSSGTDKTNCGRPCDHHEVTLQDRVGMRHRLTADVGCRNTLFNARPQSGAEVVRDLLSSGIRSFRIELLGTEPASEIANIVGLYRRLLAGDVSAAVVWKQLQAMNRVGVTRGTLEEKRDPLAIL